MSARKKSIIKYLLFTSWLFPLIAISATSDSEEAAPSSLTGEALAQQLGWVNSSENDCGGYYLEQPFLYPASLDKNKLVEITGDQTLFSQRGTSILEGKVTLTRYGQQITANKAYLYRDPNTGKLSAVDLIGNVHLREPNTLVVGKQGRYDFVTETKSLMDILYRTTLSGDNRTPIGNKVSEEEMKHPRKITNLTAWGKANDFSSSEPRIYELTSASYSTCPPANPAWRVKSSHIVLNKNTGRGYATNARILVKEIPVFYMPYINFSIDGQRKTGFLWPTLAASNKWGPYVLAPYYLNLAPNYDMTVTPGILTKRGFQLSDQFRYLNHEGTGDIHLTVLPSDKEFSNFQTANREQFENSTNPTTQAQLNRLLNDSPTRKAFSWRDDSRFNDNWSSHVDFNYAGDDYYMRDFGNNLNEITQNQLLQEGDLYYKSQNWNFIGRLQAYQTLHPIDEPAVDNQYRRFPQLMLNADYPDQPFGLDYFISNEATHFEILNNPGADADSPIGNRLHTQPGVSLPIYKPSYFINPRVQLALTDYNLYQTADTITPNNKQRSVPIFDVASGLYFSRNTSFFSTGYKQTLEPQVYYTYIPYRSQASLPNFDTTVNTLTYDQIFNYNRFTGIDRIGDANQVGFGVTTRFIDQETGLEKVRAGVGEIFYFANRRVTLCNSSTGPDACSDNPDNPDNERRLSPISGLLTYNVFPGWSFDGNSIWNPITKQLDNTALGLRYQPDASRVVNLGYSYARGGDVLSGVPSDDPSNNLKVTNVSAAWPVLHEVTAVGLWSQNWNHAHLQNLLYGLQYDSCCWAVRLVGGRAFTNLDPNNNNKPQYDSQIYLQFNLKGLGNIGTGNPANLLSSITGYNPQFGQEF